MTRATGLKAGSRVCWLLIISKTSSAKEDAGEASDAGQPVRPFGNRSS